MDRPRPSGPSMKNRYLVLYNLTSAVLWASVLGRVLLVASVAGFADVYSSVGEFAKWTQTLAFLEVVHALTGLVRSPLSTTAMQIASRLLLVWGVVDMFPRETGPSPVYSSMLVAWSVTEVIRYSYFALSLQGLMPGFLLWLRYNTFFVLYPMGITSEVLLIYKATTPAGKSNPLYQYALYAILIIYIPGSYIMYTHMMGQRRKVMRGKRRG